MRRSELQQLIDSSPFAQFCGFQISAIDAAARLLTVTMPLRSEFERLADSGQIHGGPIAALIDSVGCYAVIMLHGKAVPTISFTTDYMRPAIDTSLNATATVRKLGRSISVVDIDVHDDNANLVAVGRGTYSTLS